MAPLTVNSGLQDVIITGIQVDSITKGMLPPRMTIAQRDAIGSPSIGSLIYNTSTNQINFYDGISWSAIINDINSDKLLGRDSAGLGGIEELAVGGGIEFTGIGGIQTSALTGDVTKSAGGTSTTISNDAIITSKIINNAVTSDKLADNAVDTAAIQDNAIINTKIANTTIDIESKVTGRLPTDNGGTGNIYFLKSSSDFTTIGATTADLITIPTTNNNVYFVFCYVVGVASNGTGGVDAIVSRRIKKIKNSNGTLIVTSMVNSSNADAGISGAIVDIINSGTDIILRVTGNAGDTIKWKGSLFWHEIAL